MLSDNSIVYILYTLFLIIIVPIFLRICASTFTGGDVEAKSPIQNIVQNAAHNEQLDKFGRQFFWMCRNTLAELAKR